MRHNQMYHVSRATCAFALSLLMAASLLVDGIAATPAYAEEGEAAVEGHLSQDMALDANDEAGTAEEAAVEENTDARDESDVEPTPEADETSEVNEERVSDDLPLVEDQAPVAKAGTVVVDGLKYRVNSDGKSAELAGWHEVAPEGDVTVAARVVSGTDEYAVTKVAKEALKGCDKVESVVLPDTLVEIGKDAFAGCAALQSIVVGEANEKYASHDGMLFSKDLTTLILCPEGKGSGGGGSSLASLPAETISIAEDAFAGCTHLTAISADEKNATFASMGGMLLSKDLAKLVYAPGGIGASVTIPAEVREVAAGAFAECVGIKSIVAPGNVEAIGAGAFPVEVVANATVALAPGEDYDVRKAVWEEASFTHFSEPAAPGEVTKPSQEKSGFTYRLLDDFTLAISWEGEDEPEADLVLPTSAEIDGVEYRVTAVAANGFQGRTGLSSVQIRAPITTIGDGAFDGCANLSQVELPDGLDYIGGRAFAGTDLRSVTLPASLKTVAGGGGVH